jgi:hypothetical protein
MAAPKLNTNLAFKPGDKPKNNSPKSNSESGADPAQEKIKINIYKEKINELLKKPENAKKAVQILEHWLNHKK